MTGVLHRASRGRLLVLVTRSSVSRVLAEQAGRPIAALLTSHDPVDDPLALENVVLSLLDAGCEYFVCFGDASEVLHDRIDELIVDRASPDRSADGMTTWHDDEPAADVAEFFLNVAGAKEGSLLVAVMETDDAELANLLVKQASA